MRKIIFRNNKSGCNNGRSVSMELSFFGFFFPSRYFLCVRCSQSVMQFTIHCVRSGKYSVVTPSSNQISQDSHYVPIWAQIITEKRYSLYTFQATTRTINTCIDRTKLEKKIRPLKGNTFSRLFFGRFLSHTYIHKSD